MVSPTPNTKPHIVRKLLIGSLVLGAVVVVGWYMATNGFFDPTENIVDAGSGEAKVVEVSANGSADTKFELSGSNTDIKWTGSNSIGQTPTGFFYDLSGQAHADPDSNALTRLEIEIDMSGVKAMASSLTKKLKHKGFFEVDKFPTAKFVSTCVSKDVSPDHPEGTNFVVEGNFQLRDVTRSIKIPVQCSSGNGRFQLKSTFKINRKEFGVVYSDAVGDRLIRDSVMIEMDIDSQRPAEPSAALDSAALVDSGSGSPQTGQRLESFTETIKTTLVEFDMVFVPGDGDKGIEPFCIGKTEVTWNEFDYWALCKNMQEKNKIEEISQLLRPSSPHDLEKVYRGWGRENQPVVGISKLSAELYCKWLSAQTGKKYRLPTSTEWERAFEIGGGNLDVELDSETLLKQAWFDENAVSTDEEGFDFERAMPVGKLAPNDLGIHDMLGNVSEWVSDSDQKNVVRGGHFKLSAAELVGAHREVENQNVWNKDYPQDPKSIWWYVNADYVGFRVVCELE